MRRELSIHNIVWHYIENTSAKDVQFLAEHFRFHPLDLQDCYELSQWPKLDQYPNYFFIVFHLPHYDQKTRRIRFHELNVFIGRNYLITLTPEPIPLLNEYFQELTEKSARKPKHDKLKNTTGYLLYKILDLLFDNSAHVLDTLNQMILETEEDVYSDRVKHAAREIGVIHRNIMNLRRILKPQVRIFRQIAIAHPAFIPPTLSVYFDDVQDTLERMWSAVTTYKENVEGLHNTNESLINQQTGQVVKILTLIQALSVPGLLLTGFYGMNLEGLPFINHSDWIVLFLIATTFLIGIYIYYSYRKDRV